MSIRQHAARLNLDARITLFDIDLSDYGAGIQRFTPMNQIIGVGGYERIVSTTSSSARVFRFTREAQTSSIYVRFVVKMNPDITSFSMVRLSNDENTQRAFLQIDTTGARAPVISGKSSGFPKVTVVHTIAQGHIIVGVRIPTLPATDFRLAIFPYSNALSSWPNQAASNVPGVGVLNLVSIEVYEEVAMNNLEKIRETDSYANSGATIQWMPSEDAVMPIRWRGFEYTPLPIEAEGFEMVGQGAYPRPRLRMSNVLGTASSLTRQFNDLLGAKVTRWRTFARYLDDGITPDVNGHLPQDVYYVDLKSKQTKTVVEWELASILDQQGIMLPGRQVLKLGCQLQYRVWNGTNFVYQNVSCPYSGGAYFNDKDQTVTDPALDRCSQQLGGCLARFGGGEVPFGGFPMVGRITR